MLWPGLDCVVIVHRCYRLAHSLLALPSLQGAAHVVSKYQDLCCAGGLLDEPLDLRVVDCADLWLVVEIRYSSLIANKNESLFIQGHLLDYWPSIANWHRISAGSPWPSRCVRGWVVQFGRRWRLRRIG